MASKKLSRRQKAMTIVPLAIVSGVWTASLAGLGTATAAVDAKIEPKLPDGATVPSQAIQAPANISANGVVAPGVPGGATDSVVDGASTSGIPSAALSAYQRAAQIINSADTSCKIPWELIAGIGRVESDHGRYGGNVLSAQGVSTPGIYGIPLDGSNGTTKVADTDAGQLDRDKVWDRAVGPMQFIPSTWSSVKVDANGDGERNPQDINDASLATAVYLCSGSDDLSTTAGQRSAVYRYNHSQQYVDLVLSLMRAYSQGDYTAVPNSTTSGSLYSLSSPGGATYTGGGKAAKGAKSGKARTGRSSAGASSSRSSSSGAKSSTGSTGSSGGGGVLGGGGSGSGSGGSTGSGGSGAVKQGAKKTGDAVKKTTKATTKTVVDLVDNTAEGAAICRAAKSGLTSAQANQCGAKLVGKTVSDAKADVKSVLSSVLGGVTGGLGLG